jgi:hypothetical protein
LIEPGFWKWRFQIGNAVLMGKAKTHLMGVAATGPSTDRPRR